MHCLLQWSYEAKARYTIARVTSAVAFNGGYLEGCLAGLDFDLDGEFDAPPSTTTSGAKSPPLGQFRLQTLLPDSTTVVLKPQGRQRCCCGC